MVNITLVCRDVTDAGMRAVAVSDLNRSAQSSGEGAFVGDGDHCGRPVKQDGFEVGIGNPLAECCRWEHGVVGEFAEVTESGVAE